MPFPKGNQYAKNNPNVGAKTKAEIVKEAVKKITSDVLIELANSKVHKILLNTNSKKDIKDFGLPITLRGMVEKKEITGTINIDGLLDKVK